MPATCQGCQTFTRCDSYRLKPQRGGKAPTIALCDPCRTALARDREA